MEDEKNIQNNKFADYDEIINKNSRANNPKEKKEKKRKEKKEKEALRMRGRKIL